MCEGCQTSYIYDSSIQMCRLKDTTGLCPPDKPIYDPTSFSCKGCPEGAEYNKDEGTCDVDCEEGKKYSWKSNSCESICEYPLLYQDGECITKEESDGC